MARMAWLILFALLLAGCGQKGPLYLPGDEQSTKRYDPQDALPDPIQDSSSKDRSSRSSSFEDSTSEKDSTSKNSSSKEFDSTSQGED